MKDATKYLMEIFCSKDCGHCAGTGRELDQTLSGAYLRKLRMKSGLSLCEMAERLKFSASYVSDLELGRRQWSTKLIEAYQKALKKSSPTSQPPTNKQPSTNNL